ncbi:MAG: hypothetical protein JSS14_23330 [Proteobacteria bacterium]|nr:hypothetical protein [Pseudomonadota bacterium]
MLDFARNGQAEQKQSDLRDTEHQVGTEVVKAHADAASALDNMEASQRLLGAAQAALASVQRKYDQGVLEMLSTQKRTGGCKAGAHPVPGGLALRQVAAARGGRSPGSAGGAIALMARVPFAWEMGVSLTVGHLLYTGLPDRADRGAGLRLPGLCGDGAFKLRLGHPHPASRGAALQFHVLSQRLGLAARRGERDGLVRLMSGMLEAATHFGMRLPELFCGFERAAGEAPIAYPVACLPQAWAAGPVFVLLQACLGLELDAGRRLLRIDQPRLPDGLDHLQIRQLRLGPRNWICASSA